MRSLLAACPDLHVLATSRQALGVAGEVRMVVPSMSLPAEGEETSVQRLLGYDAVWLLSERAAAVVPGFTVATAAAGQVLALCRKLDGIPLALELAAVRLASLSLEQLNGGLATELSILGTANRGAEARQQTLEATIAGATACWTSKSACCGPACRCSPAGSKKTRSPRSAPMSGSLPGRSRACLARWWTSPS
jgi:predicted ATPase